MELLNTLNAFVGDTHLDKQVRQEVLNHVILMLSPIIPHITHTLWTQLGNSGAIVDESWPKVDKNALTRDNINLVVQVNGKLRANILAPLDANKQELEQMALVHDNVQKYIANKEIKKIIIVPQKLINIVIGE